MSIYHSLHHRHLTLKHLSLLQTKYNSLNIAESKNKNIDLQQKESAKIKEANNAVLKEANKNLNNAWAEVQKKAGNRLKTTVNKGRKKGSYLDERIGLSTSSDAYKAIGLVNIIV